MAHQIVNLDKSGVIEQPVDVVIDGVTYILPGDIPATLYAKLLAVSEGQEGDQNYVRDAMRVLADEFLAAFQVYQPELSSLPLSIPAMIPAINTIYSRENREDPTPAPAAKPRARRPAAKGAGLKTKTKPTPSRTTTPTRPATR